MAMKSYICLALCLAAVCRVDTRQRFDDSDDTQDVDESNKSKDFDFEDKKSPSQSSKSSLNREMRQMYNWWTIEDICKDVKCKSWEYCVIKSKGVAVCAPKKTNDGKEDQLLDNKSKAKAMDTEDDDEDDEDYDDDEDIEQKSTFAKSDENKLKLCNPCPVVKPEFICGSDNATYSSICRLDFHNCVHKSDVRLDCTGFCPCVKKKTKPEKKITKSRKNGKHSDIKDKNWSKVKAEKNWFNLDKNYEKIVKKSKSYPKTNKSKLKIDNKSQNSVLNHREYDTNKEKSQTKKCSAEELKSMGSRLLDWFSVVIAEQKKEHHFQNKKHLSADCEPQVWYMFNRFDTNNDLKLSVKELYYLEHDQNEHCLQPYLDQCDEDNNRFLSAYEWCTCFDKKSQPCFNALKHTKKGLLGAYNPQCDSQGFYKPMQCHSSSGICWCVDKNGVEFTNTRRRGSPDCKGLLSRARHRTIEDQVLSREDVDVDDDGGGDDDDTDGSGDGRISG